LKLREKGVIQFALKCDPIFVHTQVVKHPGQAIIVQVAGPDSFADQLTERPLMLFDPVLDVAQSVVAFGKDVGYPNDRQPSKAQSCPIAVENFSRNRTLQSQSSYSAKNFQHIGQERGLRSGEDIPGALVRLDRGAELFLDPGAAEQQQFIAESEPRAVASEASTGEL
jgi:hypothetical protein